MAGLGGSTSHVTKTEADKFIPELWSDEIIATYKANLVMAPLVKSIPFKGKKGDVVHIPKPTRGNASAKAAETMVTLIANVESEVTVTVDQHWEYSRLIEDIVAKQALDSLRRFYTEDAGYALAKKVDTLLVQLGRGINGATVGVNDYATAAASTNAFIGSTGATVYNSSTSNAAALGDAGIRRSIQRLDDNDIPLDSRYCVVPPVTRNSILGTARFTEQGYVGEEGQANSIRNGYIKDLYGVKFYVSTNADTAAGNTNTDRICLMFHKEFGALAMQMEPRTQTQYKQEYLADLLTADVLFGVGELRDNAAVALAVPA